MSGRHGPEPPASREGRRHIKRPRNPAVLEQRIGRIYRLGQHRPIDVYNLASERGIESRIAEPVGSKQAFFVRLFDGMTDEVVFEQVVAPALERAPGMTARPGTRKTVPPSGRSTGECSSELDSRRLEGERDTRRDIRQNGLREVAR